NYQLAYVGAALTIKVPPSQPTSQFTAQTGSQPANTTTMNLTAPTPTPVSFTAGTGAGGARAGNTSGNTNVASNPPADTTTTGSIGNGTVTYVSSLATNRGLTFPPISEYDAKQYSTGQLPDYDNRDSAATIFTMIARAIMPSAANDTVI